MDKQKILAWANKLIEDYESFIDGDFEEYGRQDVYEEGKQYCNELREEIKNLLELN